MVRSINRPLQAQQRNPCTLGETLDLVEKRYREFFAARKINLDIRVDPSSTVQVPLELTGLVFSNLLANASDAIGDRGSITIESNDTGECFRVAVANTGPLIPEARRARIFEPGFSTKEEGTGLGLALCRQGLEHVGGDLYLSNAHDETTFIVELPKVKEAVHVAS